MKYFFKKKYTALTWAWLILISLLAVMKIAPEGLNADILINSVMSLQKVTLYYWGQNRLLNILPLAVALLKNPTLNLAAILVLTSITFYGFLYFVSRAAVNIVEEKNKSQITFKVFLIISSAFVFVFVFTPNGISEITIGHIEYSFPALLIIFAWSRIFPGRIFIGDWKLLILPGAAIILAVGVNPSSIIPIYFAAVATAFYNKRVRSNEIALLLISGVSFFAWSLVSRLHGSTSYNEFKLEIIGVGIQKVVGNFLGAINLDAIFILIAVFSIAGILSVVQKSNEILDRKPVVTYITCSVILFSVVWLFLFSSSRYVELNQFHWRYFIYVVFSLVFLCALHLSNLLKYLDVNKSMSLAAVWAISAVIFLATPVARLNFDDYKVFQRVDALTAPGGHLYSGDYWVVWPSVLRDMMNGYEAYGLTLRGEANKEAAREYALRVIKDNGSAIVYCLNDTVQNCIAQVNSVAGPLHAVESKYIKDQVSIIKFVEQASFLDLSGANFLNLPSQVGVVKNSGKITDSRAGLLV